MLLGRDNVIMNIFKRFISIVCSLLRLVIVLMAALFSSLNKIFFDNMEVISMTLLLRPQMQDRDTLRFIDKLRFNNQELENGASIPEADVFDENDPFVTDDLMEEDDEAIDFTADEDNSIGTLPEDGQTESDEEPYNDDEDFGENNK